MRFAGKTVVITGAASGIGKATCLLFASEGATVIAGDIDAAGGEELADLIRTVRSAGYSLDATPVSAQVAA